MKNGEATYFLVTEFKNLGIFTPFLRVVLKHRLNFLVELVDNFLLIVLPFSLDDVLTVATLRFVNIKFFNVIISIKKLSLRISLRLYRVPFFLNILNSIAHIFKVKMSASIWVSELLTWLIIDIYASIVVVVKFFIFRRYFS